VRDDKLREQNKTIRQLKGQVRQLRKENKLLQAELDLIRELWHNDVLDLAKKERRKRIDEKREELCPQCGNPTVNITTVGIWHLVRCDACDFFSREEIESGTN